MSLNTTQDVTRITTPRLIVGGTHSGAGKTSVATALIAALARRGYRVQPFKVGPDFIDPGFHTLACGRQSRNLDGWMLARETNLEIFAAASAGADVAIIEGVMGLFDGRDSTSDVGSTAEMAKWLGAPVLLVVDASAMARSAAAIVRGFEDFDPATDVAGALFNRVGGPGHGELLREALIAQCRAKPIGSLRLNPKIALPERHLGLVTANETLTEDHLAEMAAWIESGVDVDALLQLAKKRSQPLAVPKRSVRNAVESRVRIGIARDPAFCFYYADNLDLLRAAGAEVIEFSPMNDAALPLDLDALYLGGGYPEIHASQLAANNSMRNAIRTFAERGGTIYAECGGFMYLTEAIVNAEGREFPMAGIFPTRARMHRQRAALTYIEAEALADSQWMRVGERIRGHEFRYSTIDPMPDRIARCFRLHTKHGVREEGYAIESVIAGYAHLHFSSAPEFAERLVAACAAHSAK